MKQLNIQPKITGQYQNGKLKYNIDVPIEGEPLGECEFTGLTSAEVVLEMNKRAQRFDETEKSDKYTPSEWINVGYYIHPATIIKQPEPRLHIDPVVDPLAGQTIPNPDFGKITAYYQVKGP